jgi:hypothetical protein
MQKLTAEIIRECGLDLGDGRVMLRFLIDVNLTHANKSVVYVIPKESNSLDFAAGILKKTVNQLKNGPAIAENLVEAFAIINGKEVEEINIGRGSGSLSMIGVADFYSNETLETANGLLTFFILRGAYVIDEKTHFKMAA